MTAANPVRPTTLDEALRALDEAETKLRSRENDETGIRRLTESVLRSEERFRMLAQGVPNHLLFLDHDLRIVFANDVFLEAFGWSAKKVVGLHISDIVGAERFLERQQYYERALAGETVTYDSTGAAGSEQGFFHFSYRPSFDDSGKVRGIFSMATDITERRKIQLELESKQAELMRAAHEEVRQAADEARRAAEEARAIAAQLRARALREQTEFLRGSGSPGE